MSPFRQTRLLLFSPLLPLPLPPLLLWISLRLRLRCWVCLGISVSGTLRWCFLSGVRISVRIFLPSILTSPLMPLVLSPLALLSSPLLFVRLPLLCLFLRCLSVLLLFLRWLLSPPFSAPSAVSVASSLPSRVSPLGEGGCLRMGSAQVVAPAPPGSPHFLLPLLFCLCLLLRFILLLCLLPGLRVSRCFSLTFGSLCVACLFRSCFGLLSGGSGIPRLPSGPHTSLLHPFLLSLPLRCCPLPQLSLRSAGLRCGSLWLCLFFHGLHFWPWWLRSSAWSFFCLSSAVWGFCGSFHSSSLRVWLRS